MPWNWKGNLRRYGCTAWWDRKYPKERQVCVEGRWRWENERQRGQSSPTKQEYQKSHITFTSCSFFLYSWWHLCTWAHNRFADWIGLVTKHTYTSPWSWCGTKCSQSRIPLSLAKVKLRHKLGWDSAPCPFLLIIWGHWVNTSVLYFFGNDYRWLRVFLTEMQGIHVMSFLLKPVWLLTWQTRKTYQKSPSCMAPSFFPSLAHCFLLPSMSLHIAPHIITARALW